LSSDCKGLCEQNPQSQLILGYKNGQRRCTKCEKYFVTEALRCYCCKNLLRCSKKYNKTKKDRDSTFVINHR